MKSMPPPLTHLHHVGVVRGHANGQLDALGLKLVLRGHEAGQVRLRATWDGDGGVARGRYV